MRSILATFLVLTIAIQIFTANAQIAEETPAVDSKSMVESKSDSTNDSPLHKAASSEGDANNGALSKSQLTINDDTTAASIESSAKDKIDETIDRSVETSLPATTSSPDNVEKAKTEELSLISSGVSQIDNTTKEASDEASTTTSDTEESSTTFYVPSSSPEYIVILDEAPEDPGLFSSETPDYSGSIGISDLMKPIILEDMAKDVLLTTGNPLYAENSDYTETPTEEATDLVEALEELENAFDNISVDGVAESTTAGSDTPIYNYNFLVRPNDAGAPCILASINATLQVTFSTITTQAASKSIRIPTTASARGACNDNDSSLTLSWSEEWLLSGENTVTFRFVKDDTAFYLDSVQAFVFLDNRNFATASDLMVAGNSTTGLRLFSASLGSGKHVCSSETDIHCGPIVVQVHSVSLIAFNDKLDVSSRAEKNCSIFSSVSVATIVGVVLGLLLAVGIVASYVWHRKRTGIFRSELP